MPPAPTLRYENKAHREGFTFVVGVDEAGRGPLAGPVVAAAVSLKRKRFQNRIRDSKKLSFRQREEAFHEILEKAFVGVGIMNEAVVDECNILQATYHAMSSAVYQIVGKLPLESKGSSGPCRRICLLIDGNSFQTDIPFSYRTIVNGDDRSLSIACASIVAKVVRDRILAIYDKIFPHYGFSRHKGYPTRSHKQAIRRYGLSFIHRRTFHCIGISK